MIQLLRAVAHLHDNWILHRDLKASNLLLSNKGILKVCLQNTVWLLDMFLLILEQSKQLQIAVLREHSNYLHPLLSDISFLNIIYLNYFLLSWFSELVLVLFVTHVSVHGLAWRDSEVCVRSCLQTNIMPCCFIRLVILDLPENMAVL